MWIGWRLLAFVPLLGCESLSGVDDLEVRAPDAGASLPSGNAGSGGTGTGWGDGAVAAPDAPDCTAVEEELVAVGDTQLCPNDCDGANVYGTHATLNMGECVALVRFALTPAAEHAILHEPGVTLELVLTRIESHAECSGSCPAGAGTLVPRPLRSDWVEGTSGVEYSGADWCRLGAKPPDANWGAPGASALGIDVWDATGSVAFAGSEASMRLPLAAASHRTTIAESELAIRIEETESGTFVAGSRESGNAPRLVVSWCETTR